MFISFLFLYCGTSHSADAVSKNILNPLHRMVSYPPEESAWLRLIRLEPAFPTYRRNASMGDSNSLFNCRCHRNDRPATEVRCVAQITTPVRPHGECAVPNVGGSTTPAFHRHCSQTSLVYHYLHNLSNMRCQLNGERCMVTKTFCLRAPTDISIVTQVFQVFDLVLGVTKFRLGQLLVLPAQEELF